MSACNQYGALGLRQSALRVKTGHEEPSEEGSESARLLLRAGFVRKQMAGIFSFLPLGLRVLMKIEQIIREEMNTIGSQEILMPALQPADPWRRTGRWEKMDDILFKLKGAGERELALGPTHEEIVTPLIGAFIISWRDLPVSVFQIQTKFRNEPRAKSGLLRGREFRMKDMYSFHASEADLDAYYETAQAAYENVFRRCGLGNITYLTYASGGAFSKYSHEYQTIAPGGEDDIHICADCRVAVNMEIMSELGGACPRCGNADLRKETAIEVGNIFKLMMRFSEAFGLSFQDETGERQERVYMGCYGIGSSRLVGTIVEACHDGHGIIWPESVAPYDVHLVSLARKDDDRCKAESLFDRLQESGITVLYDDRDRASPGEKFTDSDLIGVPWRITAGPRFLKENKIELRNRKTGETQVLPLENVIDGYRERTRE